MKKITITLNYEDLPLDAYRKMLADRRQQLNVMIAHPGTFSEEWYQGLLDEAYNTTDELLVLATMVQGERDRAIAANIGRTRDGHAFE